jgi:hypothetical protein
MQALLSTSLRSTAALLGFILSLSACAGSSDPIGGGSQPITEDESPDGGEEGSASDACAGGVAPAEAENCQVVANGLCFVTAEAACACDGCDISECAIAESFPLQAFCQDSEQPGSSDPDEPVSGGDGDRLDASDASSCDGAPSGGGSDPHPGGDECAEGTPREAPDAPCDFIVNDLCFDSGDAACACAGCASDACLVLESYPAQIRCATNE